MSPSTDSRENREFASEIKFLVSAALANQIRNWARGRLAPDPYAASEEGDGYQISYRRTARVAMTKNGPIRLTLDDNLRALPPDGLWFSDQIGTGLLENQNVLELKFRREMPVLFKYLVEEFALNPQAVSKYRLAASALGLVGSASTPDRQVILTPQYA